MNKPLTILVRIFLVGVMLLCLGAYMLSRHYDNEWNKDHPKTKSMDELKTWAQTAIVQKYCEQYAFAKSFSNETKREKELYYVESTQAIYVPQVVRNVIEDNDLPDSYVEELRSYVDAEIDKCK
ncbi:hypothetical protein [Flavobacterium sp. T12S277]|uniref:hypothetical protein n=1 Tax=Flavobacterium sp. T12S277 TaxID=3402752 RepID=UPI003AEA7086